eukprot:3714488-Prorocentrum_lima.AAC.1
MEARACHHSTCYTHPETGAEVTLRHPRTEHSGLQDMLQQEEEAPATWLLPEARARRMEAVSYTHLRAHETRRHL